MAIDERAPVPPYRIILVDDDPDIRAIFGQALRDSGRAVSTAANANEGLDQLGEPPRPAMLITDVDLGPGANGLQLADHMKIRFPHVPIILISGQWDEDIQNPGIPEAVVLRKPFRVQELLTLVAQYLPSLHPSPT